jgi:hypothetical protein
MANVAVAFENLADGDAVVLTATSQVLFKPVSELLTLHVGRKWQGSGGNSDSVIVDLGSAQSFDTVALIGTNLMTTGTTRVRVSNTDPTGATGELYDSGALVGEVDEAYGYLVTLLPAPVSGRYIRIDLTQTGVDAIEAGRLFVGLRESFEVNADFGWSYQWVDPSRVTKSIAGQSYVDSRQSYRVFEMSFSFMVEADRRGFVADIDRVSGRKSDLLWIVDPDDANLGYVTVWGLMSDLAAITQPLFDRWSKSYRIEERL